jgi:hypothetical protein
VSGNKLTTVHDMFMEQAQAIRALLDQAGLSQRRAALELECDDRAMRYWCAGKYLAPRMVRLALERLIQTGVRISDEE